MTSDPRETLEAAIARSGLSVRRFAERVVVRDERTVRRWLTGEQNISAGALTWLTRYAAGDVRVTGRWLRE